MPYGYHTILLSTQGLLAFGGKFQPKPDPPESPKSPEVSWDGPRLVKVDWGRSHSLLLDEEGGVWEAGTPGKVYGPFCKIPDLPVICDIAAGYDTSAALDTDGGLWAWGRQSECGWVSPSPKLLLGLPSVTKVACGSGALIAEASNGTLWIMRPQEDKPKCSSTPIPVHIEGRSPGPLRMLCALFNGIVLVDSEGTVFESKSYSDEQYPPVGASGFTKVENVPRMLSGSSGTYNLYLVDEDRQLWGSTVGKSLFSPFHLIRIEGEISHVVAGGYHCMVHLSDGSMKVFGDNRYNQFGCQSGKGLSPFRPIPPYSRQKSANSAVNIEEVVSNLGKRSFDTFHSNE